MPDGDKVHNKLKLRYQNPYKSLCEGVATNSQCAKSVLNALKKSLKEQGNHPVKLAKAMAECLQQSLEAGGDPSSISWSGIGMAFDELARETDSSPYVKELALRAGRDVLQAYRNGKEQDVERAAALILKQYMRETYDSEFKECIPLTPKHHDGVDEATLVQRVLAMDSDIADAIGKWANTVTATGRIETIRLPRQPKQAPVGLDDDLLCA
jgi:hypothetical protein